MGGRGKPKKTNLLAGNAAAQTADLLASVLRFLDTLPSLLGHLFQDTQTNETSGLVERLGVGDSVINESKARGPASTICHLEAVRHDALGLLHFEHLGEFFAHIFLRDTSEAGVEHFHSALFAVEEGILQEFLGADSDGRVGPKGTHGARSGVGQVSLRGSRGGGGARGEHFQCKGRRASGGGGRQS